MSVIFARGNRAASLPVYLTHEVPETLATAAQMRGEGLVAGNPEKPDGWLVEAFGSGIRHTPLYDWANGTPLKLRPHRASDPVLGRMRESYLWTIDIRGH